LQQIQQAEGRNNGSATSDTGQRQNDRKLAISATLLALLAPQFDNISKRQRRLMKELLFEFIAGTVEHYKLPFSVFHIITD